MFPFPQSKHWVLCYNPDELWITGGSFPARQLVKASSSVPLAFWVSFTGRVVRDKDDEPQKELLFSYCFFNWHWKELSGQLEGIGKAHLTSPGDWVTRCFISWQNVIFTFSFLSSLSFFPRLVCFFSSAPERSCESQILLVLAAAVDFCCCCFSVHVFSLD